MILDEALEIVNSFFKQEIISSLQELIFYQSWQGKTYREIADKSGYTEEYIRDNGAKLWQQLSREFKQKVTKQNFKQVFERYHKQQQQSATGTNTRPNQHRDWEEAIDVSLFYGRNDELATLKQWVVGDKCRLLGIFGIGGIGKTSLAVRLAQEVASEFDFLVWRSLRNAPSIAELLSGIIQFLSQQQEIKIKQNLPTDTGISISKLVTYLRSNRCLLVIDNGETILQSGTSCGRYHQGYEGYKELFKRLGEISHQSCLILTSREKPQEFTSLEGGGFPVRSFSVRGLSADICQSICQLKGRFYGSSQSWRTLTRNYSGNPLAFKIVASTIKDLFNGDIEQFLQQNIIAFDDIEDLLTEQFERLSDLEQKIMYWLAIEREPFTLNQLKQDLLIAVSFKKLLEAIKSLKRRSLIEQTNEGFTQQPLVMEYLIEQQITKVAVQKETATDKLLTTHALRKSEIKDYLHHESQIIEESKKA